MAKSPRTGGGDRARKVADRRRAAQPDGIAPEPAAATANDRRAAAGDGEPTREAIARRAYEIYTARGGTHGSDIEDWLQAERELRRT